MHQWDDAGVEADRDRLRRFVSAGDERAFAEIVHAHVDMVYAAALRQTRSPAAADEVTQAVFILLSRKAATLGGQVVLAAWLHRAAFYTARNAVRREARRRRHERRAALERGEPHTNPRAVPPTWQRLAPLLDAGVAGLREGDRQAIVLRFFQRRSLADVGRAMGISEDAAQMRVSRAVGKLRATFARAGVTLDVCSLANVVWVNTAVRAAPPAVVRGVAGAVVRSFRGPTGAAVAAVIADAVGRAMTRGRATVLTAVVCCTLSGVGGTVFLLQRAILHGPAAVSVDRCANHG